MAGATGAPVSYVMGPKMNELFGSLNNAQVQTPVQSPVTTPSVPTVSGQPASNAYTATTQQPTSGWNINTAASQGLQSSMAGTAAGMAYNPTAVATPIISGTGYTGTGYNATDAGSRGYNAALMQAGQLSNTDLGAYMNPYESSVIGGLQSDALRAQQMSSNQLGAQAQAAKAFGGSRHGVAEGAMLAENQRNLNNQVGQLRQAGYQNAQQMALADIANQMNASGTNAAAINAAGQFGAGAANQAALQNAAARNAASQFGAGAINAANQFTAGAQNAASLANQQASLQAQQANQNAGLAGSQQRLSAANQLGNLSNLGFGMGQQINNQMMVQGAMQQALQQMAMDKAAQQYAGYQQSPYQALSAMTSAVSGTPYPQSSTQTSTQNTKRGLFDYLALLA